MMTGKEEFDIIQARRYCSPVFGERVFSEKIDQELISILHSTSLTPTTWARLCHYLNNFGFTVEEEFSIIDRENRWKKYDRQETIFQLRYLYIKDKHSSNKEEHSFCHQSSSSPTYTDIDLIQMFLDNCEPWKVNPPKKIKEAAHYYHCQGARPVPMRQDVKRPAIRWKEYQERQPTLKEMASWPWDNGLLLLADDERCYLDIDVCSASHPNGIKNFNEDVLEGWQWERTPSNGYHIMGYGKLKTTYGEAVEIRGKGAYIVSAPTPGYITAV